MKLSNFLSLLFITFSIHCHQPAKVGLAIVATGKYLQFVQPLIESARKHFCTNSQVTYFVFTDGQLDTDAADVVLLPHGIVTWPFATMCRCHAYVHHADALARMDYVFACDADMLFVNEVGEEILSERVATHHPGYYGRSGTFETRRESAAYVDASVARPYFAGGFYGGTAQEFLKIARTMKENAAKDLEKDIIAIWHDESHLNCYCAHNPPTLMLLPSYCMPERVPVQWYSQVVRNMPAKLIALDKDHSALRVQR